MSKTKVDRESLLYTPAELRGIAKDAGTCARTVARFIDGGKLQPRKKLAVMAALRKFARQKGVVAEIEKQFDEAHRLLTTTVPSVRKAKKGGA
jgi:hypothetical protein